MLDKLLDVIYPRWCVGCDAWDETLCHQCSMLFQRSWVRVDSGAPYLRLVDPYERSDISPFPVWALAPYRGVVTRVIVSWKHQTNRELDRRMASILPPILESVRRLLPAYGLRKVTVVPAPSSPSRKRDGRFVVGVLAQEVARMTGWEYGDVLRKPRTRPGRFKVAKLGDRQAQQRMFAVSRMTGDVVIVDDVLTTGATLAGAAKALDRAGGRTIGAFVLAATDDPRKMLKR